MNEQTQGRAEWLANFLEKQPLAGFLALTILALIIVFVLFIRSSASERRTLREMLPLLTTFSAQWNKHLELQERMADRLDLRLAKSKDPEETQ